MKKKLLFYIILFIIPTITISAVYTGFAVYRSFKLYSIVKYDKRGWSGKVHKADPELGFAPIPNSSGKLLFLDVPVRYDENGFRVPVENHDPLPDVKPVLLTLGCSYTFGDATYAEDTFPYLVGKYLGGYTKNAGVCNYGLSQMLILAERLIPVHMPDYVIVQYSTWLVKRAISPFASSWYGKITTPYFFNNRGKLSLHPPVFLTKLNDLPLNEYRDSSKTMSDFLSFLWNVGFPIHIHDDFYMALYNLKRAIGFIPEPASDSEKIIKYVYKEIAKIAEENGAILLIVILGNDHKMVQIQEHIFPPDAILIDAQKALIERLPVVTKEHYLKQYAHWRGNPPVLVDGHPNKYAHKIIAEEIVSKIKGIAK